MLMSHTYGASNSVADETIYFYILPMMSLRNSIDASYVCDLGVKDWDGLGNVAGISIFLKLVLKRMFGFMLVYYIYGMVIYSWTE